MKQFFPGSITGLVTGIVALALVPCVGFMIYSGYADARADSEEAKAAVLRVVSGIARQQELRLQSAHSLLLALADLPELAVGDPAARAAAFADLARSAQLNADIFLCDTQGGVLAADFSDAEEISGGMREIVRAVAGGAASAVRDLAWKDARGETALASLLPVRRHGQTSAVLLASLRLSPSASDHDALSAGRALCLRIEDGQGDSVFTRSFAGDTDACGRSGEQNLPAASPLRRGVLQDGDDRHVAFAKVFADKGESPALIVSARFAEPGVFSRMRARLLTNIVLLSGAVCLAFVITWKLYDAGLRTPIGNVLAVAGRIREGRFVAPVPAEFIARELNILAEALNTMMRSLDKRNRELIAARDSATAAAAMKSEFLANLSHEIRTPMNAVLGTVYLAKNSGLGEEQLQYVTAIQEEANKLLAMINGILDFSRIETGTASMETVSFSLPEVLRKLVRDSEEEALKKGVEFSAVEQGEAPESLEGDPLRLSRMLSTFLGHALLHGKRVTVRAGCSPQGDAAAQAVVHVAINVYTGSEEENANFAKSLKTEPAAAGSVLRGQGISLAIAHTLLRLMRGTLEVHSAPDGGVTVAIRLPFFHGSAGAMSRGMEKTPGGGAPQADDAGAAGVRNMHILLVEDNRVTRRILKDGLSAAGASVRTASNGFEALALLDDMLGESPYHVVLMDLQMPELDGVAATRRLRLDERFRTLPVIAMSSRDLSGEWQQYQQAGIDDYIIKPISMPSLVNLIGKWTRVSV
jgi:signal transduction histidine kinase